LEKERREKKKESAPPAFTQFFQVGCYGGISELATQTLILRDDSLLGLTPVDYDFWGQTA